MDLSLTFDRKGVIQYVIFVLMCVAPLSMGFPKQDYWNGLPFPSPGDLPDPGMESASPALAGGSFTTESPEKPHCFL